MFRYHAGRIAAIITLLSTAALPQTGMAASYTDTIPNGVKTAYSASLVDITQNDSGASTRTLDWQQPSVDLHFNLPPSERTSEIVLTLSADPLTRVAPNTPLQVQFNGGKPVPVRSNGRGFEARVPLDVGRSKSQSNVLRISYPAPAGADCVTPAHGAWSIDLAESTLRISGVAKSRNMSLSEVTEYLQQPALSPKTVGLIARGADSTDMQALAAQGIALRTPGVPKFSVTDRRTDFNVVMVKRDRLFDITSDPMILNSEGPRIFVPRGRPTDLIFTGDTDAEILEMLELFATRRLPTTRRAISSLGELNLQRSLNSGTQKIDHKTRLIDLEVASENEAGAQTYKFGVDDPVASGGEILLRLTTAKDLAENSRLRVSLNGKSLGAAKLDKRRKSVAFDIQPGALNATSNILTLSPDLEAAPAFSCPSARGFAPGFSIGEGSKLTIKKAAPSPVTELSQLTSTGGLFAQSESYIILPRQTRDYQAALRVLGRLAKSSGQGLTLADYSRGADVASGKHVLVIGPSSLTKNHMAGAPKALREALSGKSSTGDNLLQAGFERAASLGSDNVAVQYAAAQSGPRKISRGGVAALYGAGDGTLTGIISVTPGASFSQASRTLIESDHWNAMRGGVARWTSSSVVMAQTAQSDAGIILPKPQGGFELPEIGITAIDDLDIRWPSFEWPEIDWPTFDVPDFDMPQVSLPELKWPSFASAKAPEAAQPAALPQAAEASVKLANVTPRLKPTFKRASNASAGLRGPFEYKIESPGRFPSFDTIKYETRAKWTATKSWVKTKAGEMRDFKGFEDAARATDKLQDRVAPTGHKITASMKDKLPGKNIVQIGDRTVSASGILLLMAFGLVLLLMSLSGPASRLGGRH